MATTTPNYGWTVPTSTDLVKDGATAIETLGDAIDASMNTALGTKKAGMVLLNTTSFSGVTSVSLPTGTFNSTYDNYRIILTATSGAAGGATANFRMRLSGTDATGADYNIAIIFTSNTGGPSRNYLVGQTSAPIGVFGTTDTVLILDVINPGKAARTLVTSSYNTWSSTANEQGNIFAQHFVATAYDSMSFNAGSNITGTYSVYGYNK
jgi:hypothetical protein